MFKRRIEQLRRKQAKFEEQGDFSRATHCKIIADYLEVDDDIERAVGGVKR
ncbi:MAG: hypothetical protein ABSD92_07480 [Candidatus Bathyarchaeia archaeon]|jgi:uncharacterized protein YdcH (DUF465 family)